jgi:glucosyl-3-phosphoglycerate phosphatase
MSSNYLSQTVFNNKYFAMRHGQSLASESGLIISSPADGTLDKYGLGEVGRSQVVVSAQNSSLDSGTLIYSSDFSRARQTAGIVKQIINADTITITKALRERYFGDWDKTSHDNYQKVWALDRQLDKTHQNNVEPLYSVLERAIQLIANIEKQHTGKIILFVSHGDILQILQAGLNSQSPTRHRDLPHLETAEIRQLV